MCNIKILHAGISTGNMEVLVAWYEKNLGFHVVKDDFVEPLNARVVFISDGKFSMELFQHRDSKPLPQERRNPDSDIQTVGMKHVAFSVDDMSGLKKRFETNGVDIVFEKDMGTDRVMYVRDNEGILIEFIQEG